MERVVETCAEAVSSRGASLAAVLSFCVLERFGRWFGAERKREAPREMAYVIKVQPPFPPCSTALLVNSTYLLWR